MTYPATQHRRACLMAVLLASTACSDSTLEPLDAAAEAGAAGARADAAEAGLRLPPPPPGVPVPAGPACRGNGNATPASCGDLGIALDRRYAERYGCFDLGPVPGLATEKYGGLALTTERCGSTLLIGGDANLQSGKLYAVTVTRDAGGHINGFASAAAVFADAPFVDGGVAFAPSGALLVTRWPSNQLQITRPDSRQADKVIDLAALGVATASASLAFVPRLIAPGGLLKLVSWSGGEWYTLDLLADGRGTYDARAAHRSASLPGGPEGFAYVAAGSPLFPVHGLLVSEWNGNQISAYEVDARGDPVLDTRRPFLTGLQGAVGGHRDPATGDFLFSAGGPGADRTIVVRGFAPIPAD